MGELDAAPNSSNDDQDKAPAEGSSDGPSESRHGPPKEIDNIEFKKPTLDAHVIAKKNILQKYMRQRKGFVKGGTLSSVSDESEPEPPKAEKVPEKRSAAPAPPPPPLKYETPDWADEPPDDYFLEVS